MASALGGFAARVVRWQEQHGRNHLPWQNTRDPYRVWLSEVMLQQTQVATVLRYYERFLARFPDVQALAAAHLDEVLALWSGLGYYSRARNLHRCAQAVVSEHAGAFPKDAQTLTSLPGIGRSTAAAIASLCFGERVAILDANVKRVLARVLAIEGDLASSAQQRALWDAATQLLPGGASAASEMPRYTQGMMDLGATLCQPLRPHCTRCPVRTLCRAHALGRVADFPLRSPKKLRIAESWWLLCASVPSGAMWLSQRPTPGVWAGLYCLPMFASAQALEEGVEVPLRPLLHHEPVFVHVLTHKELHLHVVRLKLQHPDVGLPPGAWFAADAWPKLGLPAPVRKYLGSIDLAVPSEGGPLP